MFIEVWATNGILVPGSYMNTAGIGSVSDIYNLSVCHISDSCVG